MIRSKSKSKTFWSYVEVSPECWQWIGATDKDGYGVMTYGGTRRQFRAHRISWELHNGKIPSGQVVRHTCDTPTCVNPDHLIIGTVKQNAQDMVERGRSLRGEKNHKSKITASTVREIRRLYSIGGMTQKQIGEKFGINDRSVSHIVRRVTWAHV